MEIIIKPPGKGKTTDLINMCDGYKGYIVCHSMEAVEHVAKLAYDLGKEINWPMTFQEVLDGDFHAPGVKEIYIDNLDLCIQNISKVPIGAVTMTDEEPVKRRLYA